MLEKFIITTEDGKTINMTLELLKSGSFDYGNGHSLLLKECDLNEQLFDARYDKRFNDEDSFRKHSLEFIREHVRSTCKVERVEV